jgi:hypothetical protein
MQQWSNPVGPSAPGSGVPAPWSTRRKEVVAVRDDRELRRASVAGARRRAPTLPAPTKAICSYGNAGGTVGKSMVSKGGSRRPAFIASKGRNPTSSAGEAGCNWKLPLLASAKSGSATNATGFRVVHEVSLHHDVSRTFSRVQTPASIAERLDVMDTVVVHNGAGLNAKRVDPHIRRHALSDRVQVIEANVVVMGVTRTVAPGPTDGNSGLVEIEDVIVLPRGVRRLSDPDSHRRRV